MMQATPVRPVLVHRGMPAASRPTSAENGLMRMVRLGRSASVALVALVAPVALAAVVLAPATPAAAQTSLGEPAASISERFEIVQTIRELRDGRVLVADPGARLLYVVDFTTGTRTVVGSSGRGADQYLQPDAVWPLPGDSTLLVDLGNGRLVTMGPDLFFGPSMAISDGLPAPGQPLVLALPQAVDGRGNIFTRALVSLGGALPDSANITRISRNDRSASTVGAFKLAERRRIETGGAMQQSVQIVDVPLSPEDAWGAGPDGSAVVARSADYHVEWISPDGTVTRGPAVSTDPIPVGEAEKEEWALEERRSGGGVGIQVEMMGGSARMTFERGSSGSPSGVDEQDWPTTKPPFYGGRLPVDLTGRAWVRRHTRAGGPSTYDVFDRSGDRVGSYALGVGDQIVGFGTGRLYAVTFDDEDLITLVRYRLP